jgi:hypothetical protein
MQKKWAVILGFANEATANRTLQLVKETRAATDIDWLLVDNHYPDTPSGFWESWAKELGAEYLNPGRNIGLHHGLNFALTAVNADRGDLMLGIDPDTRPLTVGWDDALMRALSIPDVGWASLGNDHSEGEMATRGFTESQESGLRLKTTKQAVVNSLCGFKLSWVKDVGGFQETSEYYGGVECLMFPMCVKAGLRWVWLQDYREGKFDTDLSDPDYRHYKWAHAHKGWKGDFATWKPLDAATKALYS